MRKYYSLQSLYHTPKSLYSDAVVFNNAILSHIKNFHTDYAKCIIKDQLFRRIDMDIMNQHRRIVDFNYDRIKRLGNQSRSNLLAVCTEYRPFYSIKSYSTDNF